MGVIYQNSINHKLQIIIFTPHHGRPSEFSVELEFGKVFVRFMANPRKLVHIYLSGLTVTVRTVGTGWSIVSFCSGRIKHTWWWNTHVRYPWWLRTPAQFTAWKGDGNCSVMTTQKRLNRRDLFLNPKLVIWDFMTWGRVFFVMLKTNSRIPHLILAFL